MLLKDIETTFDRDIGQDASSVKPNPKINAFPESGNKIMHDSEGWKSLETSMRIM